MKKSQLHVIACLKGANPEPFGSGSTNKQTVASIIDRIIALREVAASNVASVLPSTAASMSTHLLGVAPARPATRQSASDNIRVSQTIVDVNRLIIAIRIVMPSLLAKSVYVSVSSFDIVVMQDTFSFLDIQVALYNYLMSRVCAGEDAPDNNLLERVTIPALWDAMFTWTSGQAD